MRNCLKMTNCTCRRCGRSPSPTAWFTQNGWASVVDSTADFLNSAELPPFIRVTGNDGFRTKHLLIDAQFVVMLTSWYFVVCFSVDSSSGTSQVMSPDCTRQRWRNRRITVTTTDATKSSNHPLDHSVPRGHTSNLLSVIVTVFLSERM